MMDRLLRQLKREIKARPGKAALLGVLALVAMAVVLPRLWQWVVPGEASPVGMSPETSAASAPLPEQPEGAKYLAWHELAALVEQTPAMRPVLARAPEGRDPFASPAVAEAAQPEMAAVQAAVTQTPAELGLKLTSTVISPRRSLAIISGKVYERGARIPAAQDVVFELAEIQREQVVLVRGGRQYELKLARSTDHSNMSVQPAQ